MRSQAALYTMTIRRNTRVFVILHDSPGVVKTVMHGEQSGKWQSKSMEGVRLVIRVRRARRNSRIRDLLKMSL